MKTCKKMEELLNLRDWQIFYDTEEMEGCYANCSVNAEGRVATVRYNAVRMDGADPVRSAIHEMLHVLLGTYRFMACARYLNDGEMEMEEERVIRTLERVLKEAV